MSEGKVDTPSPCPHLNCLNRTLHFEPNPDIAGNGVVIGFVGTAYLVFVLLLAHYFVAYDPKCPPPKQTELYKSIFPCRGLGQKLQTVGNQT
ncbi:hypothetical protein Cob_v005986 [Colletotrichum orbiculare MAFF 240422]|uniref:Uncharacterized protein n=1 Tax=Colletotrichum orbiculare (strain 104-T / ATCC 96160 / CBS 514.97 / LARS 414 / MAFF 240422) TaxID=1213857 RepID=A0A484FTD6_COLOR|nr:hypothetical protein Cob_v005986 [Colletotrichum orbiculare MAFF 240422]